MVKEKIVLWFSKGMAARHQLVALKVAARYLQADLSPPLGDPGGPCHVIRRIKEEVRNPSKQEHLIQEVMDGDDLSNREVSEVYELEVASGNKLIRKFTISPHAQYRMDLRGIKINDIRQTLQAFSKYVDHLDDIKDPEYYRLMDKLRHREGLEFANIKNQLFVAFVSSGSGVVNIITTYWRGRPTPRMPSNGCPI